MKKERDLCFCILEFIAKAWMGLERSRSRIQMIIFTEDFIIQRGQNASAIRELNYRCDSYLHPSLVYFSRKKKIKNTFRVYFLVIA